MMIRPSGRMFSLATAFGTLSSSTEWSGTGRTAGSIGRSPGLVLRIVWGKLSALIPRSCGSVDTGPEFATGDSCSLDERNTAGVTTSVETIYCANNLSWQAIARQHEQHSEYALYIWLWRPCLVMLHLPQQLLNQSKIKGLTRVLAPGKQRLAEFRDAARLIVIAMTALSPPQFKDPVTPGKIL